jgi:hypothetical protein
MYAPAKFRKRNGRTDDLLVGVETSMARAAGRGQLNFESHQD